MSNKWDSKAVERWRKHFEETIAKAYGVPIEMASIPGPPKSLMEQWRDGELKPGPHMPMHNLTKLPPPKFRCWGCGCCREMAGFHHCEQCLIGRRPWTPWR